MMSQYLKIVMGWSSTFVRLRRWFTESNFTKLQNY